MNLLTQEANGITFVAAPSEEYTSEPGKVMWVITGFSPDNSDILAKCVVMNAPYFSRLMTLFVHPLVRGHSLGSKLLEFACEYVVAADNPLYVEADSFDVKRQDDVESVMMTDKQLREFYQRHGFVPVPGHPFSLVRAARTPKS